MNSGTVYWITGLAGAGKTTLGILLYRHLQSYKSNVVHLDGDMLREVFGGDHGHTSEERLQLARRYSRLCRMLAEQGVDVVCSTISMFHEIRAWNRLNIAHYQEIYLKAPIEVLIQRDQKNLYSRALRGEIDNVMGINAPIEEPDRPDVVLVNDGSRMPAEILEQLLQCLGIGSRLEQLREAKGKL